MPFALGPRYLSGEKIINSVLSKSTSSPLALSHLRQSSSFDVALVAALYGVADTVSMAPSSTYSDSDEWRQKELRVSKYEVKAGCSKKSRTAFFSHSYVGKSGFGTWLTWLLGDCH